MLGNDLPQGIQYQFRRVIDGGVRFEPLHRGTRARPEKDALSCLQADIRGKRAGARAMPMEIGLPGCWSLDARRMPEINAGGPMLKGSADWARV